MHFQIRDADDLKTGFSLVIRSFTKLLPRQFSVALVFLFLVAFALFGQSDRGTITGSVTDPLSSFVADAAVHAVSDESGAEYNTQTTSTGTYTLSQLVRGTYTVSVTKAGFKQVVRKGIVVGAATTIGLDFTLALGTTSETVTVTADTPLLQTENALVSQNVTNNLVDELPIAGIGPANAGYTGIRNPLAVTQLVPGAQYAGNNTVRINGLPNNSESIRIEGQETNNPLASGFNGMNQPSVDAIQEVSIQTSNFAAEFGQAGGGVFSFSIKSGTNQYHGSGYDQVANEVLNSGQAYTNIRPQQRRHDWGLTLGGPVIVPKLYDGRNKTFFFYNYEQYLETYSGNATLTYPTDAMRGGDLRAILTGKQLGKDQRGNSVFENTIYDPSSQFVDPATGLIFRNPFATNNVIPASQLDPIALKVQNLLPHAQLNQQTNNFVSTWGGFANYPIPALKIDHYLSPRNKISFYWSHGTNYAIRGGVGSPASWDGLPDQLSTGRPVRTEGLTMNVQVDNTLTPTLILHTIVGYSSLKFLDAPEDQYLTYNPVTELGLVGARGLGFPQFGGLNGTLGGSPNLGSASHHWTDVQRPSIAPSLTWSRGSHTIKLGAEYRSEGQPFHNERTAAGSYTFTTATSGLPALAQLSPALTGGTVGYGYASFLMGTVSNDALGIISDNRLGKHAIALYLQDSWKFNRKLSLDYGLRWDLQSYYRETYNRWALFSPGTPNPSAGGRLGATVIQGNGAGTCNCSIAPTYPYAVAPRLGAAYSINNKTVLRAGVGLSYTTTSLSGFAGQNVASAFAFANPNPTDGGFVSVLSPTNPLLSRSIFKTSGLYSDPSVIQYPNRDPGQFPFPGQLNAPNNIIDRGAGRPSRIYQWNVALQRELPQGFVVEAAYVGNRAVWLSAGTVGAPNVISPSQLLALGIDVTKAADATLLASAISSPTAKARGFSTPPYPGFPSTGTVFQSLRPFPQFNSTLVASGGALSGSGPPLGKSWYDSLQIKVTKRFSHGLTVIANAAKQKTLALGTDGAANNILDYASNKTFSNSDRPYTSTLAVNYTTPKYQGNRILGLATGGWTLAALLSYSSGALISAPAANNNLAAELGFGTFANRVPGVPLFTQDLNCHCFDPSRVFVLNPAAWTNPATGQFGTSSVYFNDYRQQRRPNENFNFGREFRIGETGKVRLNLRAEFTNIFNRLQNANPTSTNFTATQTVNPATGVTTAGFGFLPTGSQFNAPRSGLLVGRVTF